MVFAVLWIFFLLYGEVMLSSGVLPCLLALQSPGYDASTQVMLSIALSTNSAYLYGHFVQDVLCHYRKRERAERERERETETEMSLRDRDRERRENGTNSRRRLRSSRAHIATPKKSEKQYARPEHLLGRQALGLGPIRVQGRVECLSTFVGLGIG